MRLLFSGGSCCPVLTVGLTGLSLLMDLLIMDGLAHCGDPDLEWERANVTYRWVRAHSLELLLHISLMRGVGTFWKNPWFRQNYLWRRLVARDWWFFSCCVFVLLLVCKGVLFHGQTIEVVRY